MRTPGMFLPGSYLDILSSGPTAPPIAVDGIIGPSFFAPDANAYTASRKLYGGDDPDAGGYSLAQIDWSKDDGTVHVGPTEPRACGWFGDACSCEGCGG